MATVHFGGSLTRYTGGVGSISLDAPRVGELLAAVTERYPDLADPLELMAVAVDGQVHAEATYLKLSPDSDVHFVPRIAGG